jgi:hypothetical protein
MDCVLLIKLDYLVERWEVFGGCEFIPRWKDALGGLQVFREVGREIKVEKLRLNTG